MFHSFNAGSAGRRCDRSMSQVASVGRKIRPILENYRQRCAIVCGCFDPSAHDVHGLGDGRDVVEGLLIQLNILVGIWSRFDDICRHSGRDLVDDLVI